MIAYLDSSVVLRVVFNSPDALPEWMQLEAGVSSVLLRIECFRSIERLWHHGHVDADELTQKRRELDTLLRRLEVLPLGDDVLNLAADPMPTHLKTLDALHLATAILFRRSPAAESQRILFATHDKLLAKAARELHFDVIGT